MRKINFYNGGFYHVFNRGIDKRFIYGSDEDRIRFLNRLRRCMFDLSDPFNPARSVKILAFSLMPNHYHLLLEQASDGGVSKFMHRLSTSYTMYFNKLYKRSGSLFGSRYKAVEISHQSQFEHISRYIHLNPVDLLDNEKKNDRRVVSRFLEEYTWSSYGHYIRKKQLDYIQDFNILDMFESPIKYKNFVLDWLPYRDGEL